MGKSKKQFEDAVKEIYDEIIKNEIFNRWKLVSHLLNTVNELSRDYKYRLLDDPKREILLAIGMEPRITVQCNPNFKEELIDASIVETQEGYKKVIATRRIPPGYMIYISNPMTLIRFENTNRKEKLIMWGNEIVKSNQESLLNELHPRDGDILEKLSKNCFLASKGYNVLYHIGSFLNHSCVPNSETRIKEDGTFTIFSSILIEKGEEICISYSSYIFHDNRNKRMKHIENMFEFMCRCPACSDDKHIQSASHLVEWSIKLNSSPREKCLWCGEDASMVCTVCKIARYCTKECQKIHWKEYHEKQCKRWKTRCI